MSRAFVKEDVEVAERVTRRRSASGLPPGALNYLTAAGAAQLRRRLAALKDRSNENESERRRLESTLASATVVEPQIRAETVTFGAAVTIQLGDGQSEIYRIVGADEVELAPNQVSWVSPIGKALLGAEPGQQVILPGEDKRTGRILRID